MATKRDKRWIVFGVGLLLLGAGVWALLSNGEMIQSGDTKAPQELLIFAAASLTDAFRELEIEFEEQHPEVEVHLNLASSGSLQIQIEQGAPVDLFASAATQQMDALLDQKIVIPDSVQIFARNRLVVAGLKESRIQLNALSDLLYSDLQQIAIGNPKTVPAGRYAVGAFQKLKVWGGLEDKLVYGQHVRQVLQYVERGEVDLGLVYQTDLYQQSKVKQMLKVPELAHPPIHYPIGIIKESQQHQLAQKFIDLVLSPKGEKILRSFGFETVD